MLGLKRPSSGKFTEVVPEILGVAVGEVSPPDALDVLERAVVYINVAGVDKACEERFFRFAPVLGNLRWTLSWGRPLSPSCLATECYH